MGRENSDFATIGVRNTEYVFTASKLGVILNYSTVFLNYTKINSQEIREIKEYLNVSTHKVFILLILNY
jgi:hypothetical protein